MKHSYVRATLNQETNTIRMILALAMAVAATTKRVAMTLLLAVLTTATVWADILSSNGWYYNEVAGGCNITGKKTEDGDPTGITILTIPKTIDGKTVLGFSPNAFSGFTDLQTIRFYQDAAVQNMPYVQHANFTTVELINDNGETIEDGENCLPDAMTEIGNAFKGSGITSLTMPNVTSIGDRAFEGCNRLESVTFGKAATIGEYSYAFSKINNKKLENGEWVYTKTEINYPGLMANWSCYNYQYSPNLVVNCTDGSCGWCGDEWSDGMEPFQNSSCVYWTLLDDNGHLTIDCIPQDIIYDNDLSKQIIMTESWDREKVKSLTLGHVNLQFNVLNDYPNLTTVTISENVTSSSSFPFDNCTSLTTIVVDSNNPLFDSRDDCNAIIETATNTLVVGCKNTSIPNSVTTVGGSSFMHCTGLFSVTIPNSVTTIGRAAFSGCTDLISVSIPNSVTTIELSAFSGCTSLHSVIIPNSVTTIKDNAFGGCTSLTSITIPNSVTTIEYKAFEGCTSLASVIIPNSVTTIEDNAFEGCTGLTYITIPNRVTTIKPETFKGCNSLASVTIPKSVTTIREDAFRGCSSLTSIYYDGTPEQWNQVDKGEVWNYGVPSTCQVYYPAAVTTTAATTVEIPYGQEWTDIPVTVSSLNLGWFQNEGKPARLADAVAVVPYRGDATSYISLVSSAGMIDAYKGAGEHSVGNRLSEPLTDEGQSGTLWVYIPKERWDAAAAGEYSQFLYYDAAFLYNGVTPAETGIYNLGSDAMVEVRLTVPEAVTLTFDKNGGSGAMDAVSGRPGLTITLPTCTYTAPIDKTFLSWNTKADGTGRRYYPGDDFTVNMTTTLYAEWGGWCEIDLTDVSVKVITQDEWGLLSMLHGYFYYGDDGPLFDVNLDGKADLELLRPEYNSELDDYVGDYAVRKLAEAANLNGSYRFLLPPKNSEYEEESGSIVIIFGSGATVQQPAIELLYDNNGTYNSEKLLTLKDGQLHNLMLSERTLYRDGYWNTLCLPFDVVSFTGTPLEGATVMELDTDGTYDGHKTGLEGTTLYLNFKDATSIEAGKPYIVKWTTTATNIVNPVFCSVTVTAQAKDIPNPYRYSYNDPETITVAAPTDVSFTGGKFCGTYDPTDIYDDEHDKFYLGNNNKLYWPETDGYSVKAFRAYFDLSSAPAGVRDFVLNFDEDDATGIISTTNLTNYTNSAGAGWYDLSGRKLSGKPTKKGLYINNGNMVVIK